MLTHPELQNSPINLGNPHEFSMLELAKLVIEQTNSKSKITFLDLPQDDPKQRKPDISLAKLVLNWKPSIELRAGVQKTINYFQSIV
jgi:UDP-glucuronate decarboxylase